jgi:hypothetical protein
METKEDNNKSVEIGKMKFSKVYPQLKEIVNEYGLNLKNVKHFKIARLLLVNRYNSGSN